MRSFLVVLLGVLILTFFCGCKSGTKIKPAVEPTPEEEVMVEEEPIPTPPPQAEEIITEEPVDITLNPVYFDFDKYFLRDDAKSTLNSNAMVLKQNPEIKIRIEGNCDERGTAEYNLALGEKRAKAAKDYLVNLGISPNRITVISYGKEKPLFPAHSEEAWSKNRRDDFVVVFK